MDSRHYNAWYGIGLAYYKQVCTDSLVPVLANLSSLYAERAVIVSVSVMLKKI
jgi:hypothetical protein